MRFRIIAATVAFILSGCATSEVDLSRDAEPIQMEQWVQRIMANYPSPALREEHEGRVGLVVTVDLTGRAITCRVAISSGFSTLDDAACSGMVRYARFEPALDRDGNPTRGSWSTYVVYAMN